jgi:hypothetical protein
LLLAESLIPLDLPELDELDDEWSLSCLFRSFDMVPPALEGELITSTKAARSNASAAL